MASTTVRVPSSVIVRASWNTRHIQQRSPYNRNTNPPRKLKLPDSYFSSTSQSQPNHTSINVDQLLKFDSNNVTTPNPPIQETVNSEESTYLGLDRWLPCPPKVEKPRSTFNAATLAYIGDCIYELYARRHFLAPALNIEEYNDRVMAVVRCEAQDALLQKLLDEDFLSSEERDVLRWGKNITSSKTRTIKRAGVAVYNRASSLETLIGYLYLANPKRLEDMMSKLGFTVGVSNQSIINDLKLQLRTNKPKRRPKVKSYWLFGKAHQNQLGSPIWPLTNCGVNGPKYAYEYNINSTLSKKAIVVVRMALHFQPDKNNE